VVLAKQDLLPIGRVAMRSGVATSALRFYESTGLISSERTGGGHRLYPRHVLRRVAFIRVAQRLGLSLEEIADALTVVPHDRAPTKKEWERLSRSWRARLDERITALQDLRNELGECIGCGCLSLARCHLANPGDRVARNGAGPRYWVGDPRPS